MNRSSLLLTCCLLSMTVSAQTFDRALLDSYFDSLAHHDQAMGTLSIFQDGEEVYARSVGYADPDRTVAATPDHTYRIGSITKTFTAVIIHRLAQDGRLSLDDPLAKYYPDVPNAADITLDQMLRHQSGIRNYTAAEDFAEWVGEDQTPEELVRRIETSEPAFSPGENVDYSNSNFLLLGYIAERVSGKTYPQLLRDFILEPAGLKNTYYGGPYDAGKNEVVSFQATADDWVAAGSWSMTNAGAAGALTSTAADLNVFYGKLLRGELLPMSAVEQMMRIEQNMGQGLITFPFGKQRAFGHTGGIEGFVTVAGHFPESDLTITYLSNGVRLPMNDIPLAALTIYHGLPFEMPDLTPVPDLPEDVARQYEGTYASESFPLDIRIFVEEGRLYGQATGQGPFPLTPDGEHTFVFKQAVIQIKFEPENDKMNFLQGGGLVEMYRK